MKLRKTAHSQQGHTKVKLLVGLVLIFVAFVGTIAAVYLIMQDADLRAGQVEELQGQMEVLAEEKDIVEEKNAELASRVGKGISLDTVMEKAEEVYSDEVKQANTGTLWVDREADIWIVTLGAVNGLKQGTELAIYDGDQRINTVKVDTPLDVISYVSPIPELKNQFDRDYFRVVIE